MIASGGTPRGLATPSSRFVVIGVLAAAFAASLIAAMGTTIVLVTLGGLVLAGLLVVIRRRQLFVALLMIASLQFMLHKTFGPIEDTVKSGANALYVTSVDVLLLLLLGLWLLEGTLLGDLNRELRRSVLLLPLLPIVASVPSLFNADSIYAAMSEIVRMAWMWVLFVYFAVRVRTRTELSWMLAALFAVSAVQLAIVVMQWRTGGHLGLAFLGEDQSAQLRTTDRSAVFRPTGTSIHPDILAALVGTIGITGLALALNLKATRHRLFAAAGASVSLAAMVLTQTRGTLLGAAAAGALLVGHALWTRRLSPGLFLSGTAVAAVAAGVYWPQLQSKVIDNFLSDHFGTEVEARMQLASIATQMAEAHPFAGVGLNNFMAAMPTFNLYGVIYPGFPVHNLPLLVLAETGIYGVAAWLVVYAVLGVLAWRLARAPDRLLAAFGLGVLAAYVFFAVEEQFSFALREDAPSALFWILAGLSLAALRLSGKSFPITPGRRAG